MNRLIFPVFAVCCLILSLGVNAAQANSINHNTESFSTRKFLADSSHHGKRMGRGERMQKILEQLDLTSEQSQQIETIQAESRNQNESLQQKLQEVHAEMRSLLASDASVEQLREQQQKIQTFHQQLGDNRFETMLKIREVLTPEQRSQLGKLMAQKPEKRGEGRDFFER